jgi:hypothetical protein
MRPQRARLSKDAEGVLPSMLTTSFWPIICVSDGAEATAGADDVDAVKAATTRPRAARRESRVVRSQPSLPGSPRGRKGARFPASPLPQPPMIGGTAEIGALVTRLMFRGNVT